MAAVAVALGAAATGRVGASVPGGTGGTGDSMEGEQPVGVAGGWALGVALLGAPAAPWG